MNRIFPSAHLHCRRCPTGASRKRGDALPEPLVVRPGYTSRRRPPKEKPRTRACNARSAESRREARRDPRGGVPALLRRRDGAAPLGAGARHGGGGSRPSAHVRRAARRHRRRLAHVVRSEEHTSELQSLAYLVCRLLLEKKKKKDESHICA